MAKLLLFLLFLSTSASAKVLSLPLNPPREYDFQDREYVLSVRKKMLKQYPAFYAGKYKNNRPVFEQIIDGKPWWGLDGMDCWGSGERSIEGASEESRFIDNPFLLVGVEQAFATIRDGIKTCPGDYPRPDDLKYDTTRRHFSVVYDVTDMLYGFTGKNARDFGVSYVYADKVRGIKFKNKKNVSSGVYQFKDFIHLGGSCGYPGGCNNGSPEQPELVFKVFEKNSYIHFKLWKNKPKSKNDKADITYEIYFK
ncbi:MAG: hypothetical protein E7013_01350 [Alphaproteobacteria bacterium]|nr:hypothetical protein [Alphaproteobacteria bacterium]